MLTSLLLLNQFKPEYLVSDGVCMEVAHAGSVMASRVLSSEG